MTERQRRILQLWRWLQRPDRPLDRLSPLMYQGGVDMLVFTTHGHVLTTSPDALDRKRIAGIIARHLRVRVNHSRVREYLAILQDVETTWGASRRRQMLRSVTEGFDVNWRRHHQWVLHRMITESMSIAQRRQIVRLWMGMWIAQTYAEDHGSGSANISFSEWLSPDILEVRVKNLHRVAREYRYIVVAFDGLHVRAMLHNPQWMWFPGLPKTAQTELRKLILGRGASRAKSWWTIQGPILWMGKRGHRLNPHPNVENIYASFTDVLLRPAVEWDVEQGVLHVEGVPDCRVPADVTRLRGYWIGDLVLPPDTHTWGSWWQEHGHLDLHTLSPARPRRSEARTS